MAKAKIPNPSILVDGELVPMSDEQFSNYKTVVEEAEQVMLSKKQEQIKKENALGKLVALGLTEEDLRSVGL
jgi:hypothetical protein